MMAYSKGVLTQLNRVARFPCSDIEKNLIDSGFDSADSLKSEDQENGVFYCTVGKRTC